MRICGIFVRRRVWVSGVGVLFLCVLLAVWMASAEKSLRVVPSYPRVPISQLVAQKNLRAGDYETLLLQTGLASTGVDLLRAQGEGATLLALQEAFFRQPTSSCAQNTLVSAQEQLVDAAGNPVAGTDLIGLEDGDILVTPNCHTFGWRNGHMALVVNAAEGLALESVVLGQNSSFQSVEKWRSFPSFLVLRLKGHSQAERGRIAQKAATELHDLPYALTVGLFTEKFKEQGLTGTHCAHLVWQAYRLFGFDLDSTGGAIVTPKDVANSPLLEVKQIYGLDPQVLWG